MSRTLVSASLLLASLLAACPLYAQGTPAASSSPDSGATPVYELVPNEALQGATGRLVVGLPDDAPYVLFVFRPGTDELITGTAGTKTMSLIPGTYDIAINTGSTDYAKRTRVTGVPVEKGKDTRLKTGVLNVSVEGIWWLYDEARANPLISANGSQRVGLLAGKYHVKVGDEFLPVEIKDGEVTEF